MQEQYTENSDSIKTGPLSFIKNFENEISKLDPKEKDQAYQKLSFLFKNIDPFNTQDISSELESILKEFQLGPELANPYQFTNTALQMLDLLEPKRSLN